jgi:tRNA 2-thiouridine synthesizing protein A
VTDVGDAPHVAKTLDTTGLRCPLPVLKARRAMKELAPGEVLEVRATDPGAVGDFAAFCTATGDALLESRQEGELYIFRIRKAV